MTGDESGTEMTQLNPPAYNIDDERSGMNNGSGLLFRKNFFKLLNIFVIIVRIWRIVTPD
jgi:hypothetical protein